MKTYWISVNMSRNKKVYKIKDEIELVEQVENELMWDLGFYKHLNDLVFKTTDEMEMQETVAKAMNITGGFLREIQW